MRTRENSFYIAQIFAGVFLCTVSLILGWVLTFVAGVFMVGYFLGSWVAVLAFSQRTES